MPDPTTRDQYGGQRGYLMTMVAGRARRPTGSRRSRSTAAGSRSSPRSTGTTCRPRSRRSPRCGPKGKLELHVGLASVEPGTGAVRAIIGGRNFLGSQQNWATSLVQPGSTFKAFALAAGLSDGFTLDSTFDGNSPFTLPDGAQVHNEGEASGIANGQSYGTISLRYATEQSVNTAFVDLTTRDAQRPAADHRRRGGRRHPERHARAAPFDNVALGTASVSPLAMADAYATFAANGKHADWYVIQSVSDSGRSALRAPDQADAALQPGGREQRDLGPAERGQVRDRAARAGAPAAGGRQDRHRHRRVAATTCDGARVVVVVRRLHPAARDGGGLHARRRQRPARRLPRHLLRRGLPDRDLDRVHDGGAARAPR